MYTIYSKPACPQCDKAIALLAESNVQYTVLKLGVDYTREELLELIPTARMMPQVLFNGTPIGSYVELVKQLAG